MPGARVIDLVFTVVFVLLLMRMLPSAWNIARIYFGIRSRRLADARGLAPLAPPAVAAMADRLGALGFQRLGERTLVLPGAQRRFEWNLVDQSTTTFASIVPGATLPEGVLLGFYSAFGDGAFVATNYPRGQSVQRPDFLGGAVGTSPEDAYAEHERRVRAFATQHGRALLNRSMADLLARDDTYRSRHGGITLRRRVYTYLALAALVLLAAALSLVRFITD